MTAAYTLLSLALSLLIAAQQPNVPAEIRTYAVQVAQSAIQVANAELASKPAPAVIFTPNPVITAAPEAQTVPVAPLYSLQILSSEQDDQGRWNHEKGHGCFRTVFDIATYKDGVAQSGVLVSVQGGDINGNPYTGLASDGSIKAHIVFNPATSTPQTLTFVSEGASATYECR